MSDPARHIANESADVTGTSRRKLFVGYLRVSSAEQTKTNERDGLSIDVQRDMVGNKAEQLGGSVVEWFIDPGRSAKNLNRPDLTRMRQYLRDHPEIDGAIVGWVDRLSRNTEDSAILYMEFRELGVQFISCSETFDETPAGKFMRAIFTAKAQLDNDDRAERVTRGIQKKLEEGGTPTRAHIGYRNIRRPDGKAIVVVDKKRIGHIRWAFEQYATGEWSDNTLWIALVERGLTSQPRSGQPEVPIARSLVGRVLTDRYYLGEVSYKSQWYPGAHVPTISSELFDRVQEVRRSRDQAGEKRRKHHHYLKGTLFCGFCGSRLGFTPTTGNGGTYDYLYCIGRHKHGRCEQPYVTADKIEPQVDVLYSQIRMRPEWRERVRTALREDAQAELARRQQESKRQQRRLDRLVVQRQNLARSLREAPRLAAEINGQLDEIDSQERAAKRLLADATVDHAVLAKVFAQAEELIDNLSLAAYMRSEHERRVLNQFFFDKILVKGSKVVGVVYSEDARLLLGYPPVPDTTGPDGQQGNDGTHDDRTGTNTPRPLSGERGLNNDSLVGAAGIEPATARV